MSERGSLRLGVSQPGDIVMAVGTPCVGNEVVPAEKMGKTADVADVLKLRGMEFIHEVIPAGSEGIAHEINVLAASSKLKFKLMNQSGINLKKSAGPATVVLASLSSSKVAELEVAISKPVNIVGQLF